MSRRTYDSTVARIAGSLLSGVIAAAEHDWDAIPPEAVHYAVKAAWAVVDEVERQQHERNRPVSVE